MEQERIGLPSCLLVESLDERLDIGAFQAAKISRMI
jgi:hypothetical protein